MRGIDEVHEREITKEQYDRAMQNHRYLVRDDMNFVFNEAERYGYGVYGGSVIEKEGKYYVQYSLGSTCD